METPSLLRLFNGGSSRGKIIRTELSQPGTRFSGCSKDTGRNRSLCVAVLSVREGKGVGAGEARRTPEPGQEAGTLRGAPSAPAAGAAASCGSLSPQEGQLPTPGPTKRYCEHHLTVTSGVPHPCVAPPTVNSSPGVAAGKKPLVLLSFDLH